LDYWIIDFGFPFSRPGTSVAVSITVVVAQKVFTACFTAGAGGEGLIDGLKELCCYVFGEEGLKEVEVIGCL
jgi:hypothetical protein